MNKIYISGDGKQRTYRKSDTDKAYVLESEFFQSGLISFVAGFLTAFGCALVVLLIFSG